MQRKKLKPSFQHTHSSLSCNSFKYLFSYKYFFIIPGRRRSCLRENNENKFQQTYPNGSSHYFRKCKFNVKTMIILYLVISTIGVTGESKSDLIRVEIAFDKTNGHTPQLINCCLTFSLMPLIRAHDNNYKSV